MIKNSRSISEQPLAVPRTATTSRQTERCLMASIFQAFSTIRLCTKQHTTCHHEQPKPSTGNNYRSKWFNRLRKPCGYSCFLRKPPRARVLSPKITIQPVHLEVLPITTPLRTITSQQNGSGSMKYFDHQNQSCWIILFGKEIREQHWGHSPNHNLDQDCRSLSLVEEHRLELPIATQ